MLPRGKSPVLWRSLSLWVLCASAIAARPAFAQSAATEVERLTFLGHSQLDWVTVVALEFTQHIGEGGAVERVAYRGWYGHGNQWRSLRADSAAMDGPTRLPDAFGYAVQFSGQAVQSVRYQDRAGAFSLTVSSPYAAGNFSRGSETVYAFVHQASLTAGATTADGILLREHVRVSGPTLVAETASGPTRLGVAERIIGLDNGGTVWFWRDTASSTQAFRVDADGRVYRATPAAIRWPRTGTDASTKRTLPRNWRVDALHAVGRLSRTGYHLSASVGDPIAPILLGALSADGQITVDGAPRKVIAAIWHAQYR